MSRLIHCMILLFALDLRYSSGSDTEGDDCTSGFMSVDRMDRLLRINAVNSLGTLVASENYQGIFPEVGFTCSGSISGLLFGAQYSSSSSRSLLPELQIWRPDGDCGSYTRVGNATIDHESTSTYHNYTLSSPLPFQAGDVIGIYQPHPDLSRLRIYMQGGGRRKTVGYFYSGFTPASDLYLPWGERVDARLIVYIISDVPGCVRQFMSVERIRLLLSQDSIESLITTGNRQQISPEMNFTCDGMITKWILGADWSITIGDTLFPELQIWRNSTNGTFEKISGTQIYFYSQHTNRSYEYTRFSPIPVKAGDILGIFLPQFSESRLSLRSENRPGSPTQYDIDTGTAVISPYNVIDYDGSYTVTTTSTYHPLVSVEFVRSSPTPSVTSTSEPLTTSQTPLPTSVALPEPESDTSSSDSSSAAVAAGVGFGIAVFLALVIATVVVVMVVLFTLGWRLKRTKSKSLSPARKSPSSPMTNPVYAGPSYATTRLGQELHEMHQQADDGEGAVYEMPQSYGSGSQSKSPPTSASEYAKFDNLLYEQN